MNLNRTKSKILGRQAAKDLHSLLVGTETPWADGAGADYAESFLREMASLLPSRLKEEEKPTTNIATLSKTKMGFGEYQGVAFEDVPIGYLEWVCGEQENSVRALQAYLNHPNLRSFRTKFPN